MAITEGVPVNFFLTVPKVPNFVRVQVPGSESVTVSIAQLSDADLDRLAEAWKLKLKARAAEIRGQQNGKESG